MSHPDEAVKPVEEVESRAIAEAQLRHEQAGSDQATDQEKKQAAVEQAHALSTRPDGSYAQLHETAKPTLAVADGGYRAKAAEQLAEDEKTLNSPEGQDEGKTPPQTQGQSQSASHPVAQPSSATSKR